MCLQSNEADIHFYFQDLYLCNFDDKNNNNITDFYLNIYIL
jgi:hypothetical protein